MEGKKDGRNIEGRKVGRKIEGRIGGRKDRWRRKDSHDEDGKREK